MRGQAPPSHHPHQTAAVCLHGSVSGGVGIVYLVWVVSNVENICVQRHKTERINFCNAI